MRTVWTTCRGSDPVSRRRVGGDCGAYRGSGWYIGQALAAVLALSVYSVVRRYVVVRLSLYESVRGVTPEQLPLLALVP